MNKIMLVACVGKKLDHPAKAADLYQSDWFKKASSYAELTGDRWYILSAKHGLVSPGQVLEPYNLTLNTMRKAERIQWAENVLAAMKQEFDPLQDELVFLAGKKYREPLVDWLQAEGFTVSVPMAGLGIGQQLAWLKTRIYGAVNC